MNHFRMFLSFLGEILAKRHVVFELTRRDFKAKYLGSYLGLVWAFVFPIVNIAIFWFVFSVVFKAAPVADHPYLLWLISGMIPWLFFNDSINNGMQAVLSNSFLVKKLAFSIGLLPIVKVLSALVIHLFFLLLIFFLFAIYGFPPTIYVLQVPYYLFAGFVLATGISWFTSSIILFFRDMGQIVGILLQILFYLTPIVWSPTALPAGLRDIIKLNPIYYLIEGYRNSFILRIWFWEHAAYGLYFWSFTAFAFVGGAVVFRRLRPHFADVL